MSIDEKLDAVLEALKRIEARQLSVKEVIEEALPEPVPVGNFASTYSKS